MSLKSVIVIIGVAFIMMQSVHSSSLRISSEENNCICTREYFPLCASNGVTYSNWCLFECDKERNTDLLIKFEGDCDEEYY